MIEVTNIHCHGKELPLLNALEGLGHAVAYGRRGLVVNGVHREYDRRAALWSKAQSRPSCPFSEEVEFKMYFQLSLENIDLISASYKVTLRPGSKLVTALKQAGHDAVYSQGHLVVNGISYYCDSEVFNALGRGGTFIIKDGTVTVAETVAENIRIGDTVIHKTSGEKGIVLDISYRGYDISYGFDKRCTVPRRVLKALK